MKYLFIIPIVLALIAFFSVIILKKKTPDKKFRQRLLVVGVVCCILSMVCLFMAYYISGDKTNLYKSCLPVGILVIAIEQLRRNKKSVNEN